MKPLKLLLLIVLTAFTTHDVVADTTASKQSFVRRISFEMTLNRGVLYHHSTTQDIGFNLGYRNLIFTARFVRYRDLEFTNDWMLGFRYPLRDWASITVSTGLTDMAWQKNNHVWSETIDPENYDQQIGFCTQIELAARLKYKGDLMPIGISSSFAYHVGYYRKMPLLSAGIKLYMLPVKKGKLTTRISNYREKVRERRERRATEEYTIPKNIIRTKLLFGVYMSTFIEYERGIGSFSVTGSAGAKYGTFIGQVFQGANAFLKGPEASVGLNYRLAYKRTWLSFGVKGIYRHRENSHFWAYIYGSTRSMSRISDDYLALAKISLNRKFNNGLNLEWYVAGGMGWAYQKTTIADYITSYQQWLNREPYREEGWVRWTPVQAGMNIGFGW